MSPFAEALRTIRVDHALRQQELAELLGCDRSYLSALENDAKPPPRPAFVETLISVLQLPPEAADAIRRARERSRRRYALPGEMPEQTYAFVHELFRRLDRLNPRQVSALHAVLEIADPVWTRPISAKASRLAEPRGDREGAM